MTYSQFRAGVKQFGGWIEDGAAYFPSVHACRQFAAIADTHPKDGDVKHA